MSNKLLDKLKKNTVSKYATNFAESEYMNQQEFIQTPVPALNVALSGKLDGGLGSGITVISGGSKRFKSLYSLILAQAYMKKYPDSAILYYNSEFGMPPEYFESVGIDVNKVFHIPCNVVEELRNDLVSQLDGLDRGERVFILVDSLGNMESLKATTDARDNKTTDDMTRAKKIRGMFRMITLPAKLKNIPGIFVNHSYNEIGMYPKEVSSGGDGPMYAADNLWMIKRIQEKDGKEVVGYTFKIKVEKSRFVKEGSEIPIDVKFDGGMNRWSGLLDWALESGHVIKPSQGWYQRVIPDETGKMRRKETDNAEFWLPVLKDKEFRDYVESKFSLPKDDIIKQDVVNRDEVK